MSLSSVSFWWMRVMTPSDFNVCFIKKYSMECDSPLSFSQQNACIQWAQLNTSRENQMFQLLQSQNVKRLFSLLQRNKVFFLIGFCYCLLFLLADIVWHLSVTYTWQLQGGHRGEIHIYQHTMPQMLIPVQMSRCGRMTVSILVSH